MGSVIAMTKVELNGDGLRARIRALLEERGAKQAALADEVGMSSSAVSQWMNGKYLGDVMTLEGKLRQWVEQQGQQQEASAAVPDAPAWVPTPSGQAVLSGLRHAKLFGDMAVVYGGAGLGKSTAVRQYQREALNVWVATMTPAHAGLVPALRGIAAAVGAEAAGGAEALYREIVRKVDKTAGLLVIDEAQHLGVPALEQIRAINDETGIGIALVGNERIYAQMSGGSRALYLDRLHSRIGTWVRLRRVQAGDVEALVSEWPVDRSCKKELQGIAGKPGALRILTKVLKLASMHAAAAGRKAIELNEVRAAWGELGGAV